MLITGGSQGLGMELCQRFGGVSVSRSTGTDINKDANTIAAMSLDHDVFINNAYDGTWGVTNGNFAQVKLLSCVASLWKQHQKSGYIINIGGIACAALEPPCPDWDLYATNKAALRYHSQQWSRAFKQNLVAFKTTVINVDRLDTPLGRQTPEWNGRAHDLTEVGDMIALCLATGAATCIEEISAWVNLDHKQ